MATRARRLPLSYALSFLDLLCACIGIVAVVVFVFLAYQKRQGRVSPADERLIQVTVLEAPAGLRPVEALAFRVESATGHPRSWQHMKSNAAHQDNGDSLRILADPGAPPRALLIWLRTLTPTGQAAENQAQADLLAGKVSIRLQVGRPALDGGDWQEVELSRNNRFVAEVPLD